MEFLIGMAFKDFVLVAADTNIAQQILLYKRDDDKMHKLSDHLVMLVSGEAGDTVQFAEFIAKNIQLYKMRNGYELSTTATANYTRRNLADYLRSRTPYAVNVLLAGCDPKEGPGLFYIDHLATMAKLPYAAHGYGGIFTLSIMDKFYRQDMSQEEGLELLRRCFMELNTRFLISMQSFKVRVVNKDGIQDLPDVVINSAA